jgi:hypothetical protein
VQAAQVRALAWGVVARIAIELEFRVRRRVLWLVTRWSFVFFCTVKILEFRFEKLQQIDYPQ